MYLFFDNPSTEKCVPDKIPSSLKRRIGALGAHFFDTILKYTKNDIAWVVSTRHGDSHRMIKMFDCLFLKKEISPTDFSLSVHNALIGQYSIFKKNTQNMTALSAGKNSFALGFFEAYVQAKTTKKTVGYVYYDAPLDSVYDTLNQTEEVYSSLLFSPLDKGPYFVDFNQGECDDFHSLNRFHSGIHEGEINTSFGSFLIKKV